MSDAAAALDRRMPDATCTSCKSNETNCGATTVDVFNAMLPPHAFLGLRWGLAATSGNLGLAAVLVASEIRPAGKRRGTGGGGRQSGSAGAERFAAGGLADDGRRGPAVPSGLSENLTQLASTRRTDGPERVHVLELKRSQDENTMTVWELLAERRSDKRCLTIATRET
jgi:hypothetical protein